MISQRPSDVLSHYAHSLQIASPREWEAFVQCFDAYATEVTVAVIASDQNSVLNMQGRAQAFLHLLELFKTCHVQPQKTKPAPAA